MKTLDSNNHLSVVIPAYHAEATIANVIDRIPAWIDFIIVVDDCSPDSTAQIVKDIMLRDARVHLLQHSHNLGVGGSVLSGYQEALLLKSNIIIKMDSDGQMDPVFLSKLINPILTHNADYTKGNRFLHARELNSMPWIRRIGNLGLSFLTKLASGYWNIFDPSNGYTAVNAAIIPLLNQEKIGKRYFFETSMLIELGICRAVVKDISIPAVYGNETSSLSELNTVFEFPPKLVEGLIRRVVIEYFLRDFTATTLFLTTGIILSLFGLVWGISEWIWFASIAMPTPTGTIMIAVLPLILGVQLLLQAIVMDIHNVPVEVIHLQND